MKLKLCPDYFSSPLWRMDGLNGDESPEIDPSELQISYELIDDLWRWASEYDATLNTDDPPNSGFLSIDDEFKFKRRGAELAEKLRKELSGKAIIKYYYDHEV